MTVTEPTPGGPDPGLTAEDQAFLERLLRLGPEVFAAVGKAAVTEAINAVPTPTFRPGKVEGVDSAAKTASVTLDGDSTATLCQVLCELPYANARVMVEFVPPSAVFVVGFVGPCGVPSGVLAPFAGPITAHANAANAQFTSNQPPPGWLWCAGQAVSRTTYAPLFAAIGTAHGVGDGATTFAVPDLRGRTLAGLDDMGGTDAGRLSLANTLGTTGGAETHTIAQGNLPSVNFTVSGSVNVSDPGHTHSVSNLVSTTQGVAAGVDYTGDVQTTTIASASSTTGITASLSGATAASGGSGTAVNHLPPVMVIHIIIKT